MKKLLLLLKLPPPTTGVTKMSASLLENRGLFSTFKTEVIGLSYAKDVKNTGELHPGKFITLFVNLAKTKIKMFTFRPDLVYFVPSLTGAPFLRDFLFILILKFFRRKIIFHLHGTGLKESATNSEFYKTLYKFSFNNSELIILSERLIFDIDFLNPKKIHILPNGIAAAPSVTLIATAPPTPLLTTAPPAPLLVKVGGEELGGKEKGGEKLYKLLFVSNFYEYKGIRELIELLSTVHELGYKFKCTIAGEENDVTEKELSSLILGAGLSANVNYVGKVSGDQLWQLYSDSDIFIYPTKRDAMPLVILEAMRAGLAVLANPVGAIPDMIGDDHKTFPTAENLIELLRNPDKIIKLGEQNRKSFVEKFTLDIFHQNLLRILNDRLKPQRTQRKI